MNGKTIPDFVAPAFDLTDYCGLCPEAVEAKRVAVQKVVEENRVAVQTAVEAARVADVFATYAAAGEEAAVIAGTTAADANLDTDAIDLAKATARTKAIAEATKANFSNSSFER